MALGPPLRLRITSSIGKPSWDLGNENIADPLYPLTTDRFRRKTLLEVQALPVLQARRGIQEREPGIVAHSGEIAPIELLEMIVQDFGSYLADALPGAGKMHVLPHMMHQHAASGVFPDTAVHQGTKALPRTV